jgi:tellurite resistance protein
MSQLTVGAPDLASAALSRLVGVLCEDAIFALSCGGGDVAASLEGLGKRRVDAYNAALQGMVLPRMGDAWETWIVQMVRAMAPVAPPVWLPMMDVVHEKVTLEIGARGLRSLFSSKPSDKDVARVKKIGTLAVRLIRGVLAADGVVDEEEAMMINAIIGAFGLPEADARPLYAEPPLAAEMIEVPADIEPGVARALVRGAWLGAASDALDPREEHVVRVVAQRLGVPAEEVEEARAQAQVRIESRRLVGLAVIDAIRYVLSDRAPGLGVTLAAMAGTLVTPRRYREEAHAQIGHGSPVTLGKRYVSMPLEDKMSVLGIAWAAALMEDPTIARRSLVGARWERLAQDIGEDGERGRAIVDGWVNDSLTLVARTFQ